MKRFEAIRTRETALGDLVITIDWDGFYSASTTVDEPRGPGEVLVALRRLTEIVTEELEGK